MPFNRKSFGRIQKLRKLTLNTLCSDKSAVRTAALYRISLSLEIRDNLSLTSQWFWQTFEVFQRVFQAADDFEHFDDQIISKNLRLGSRQWEFRSKNRIGIQMVRESQIERMFKQIW